MFGLFKKKDQYLLAVAKILHHVFGETLPLDNAYNLAKDCFDELRQEISKGTFRDGPNPRATFMAYYCLSNMLHTSSAADNKSNLTKTYVALQVVEEEFRNINDLSMLEKGIAQFAQHVLSEINVAHSEKDVDNIKLDSVQKIVDLMTDNDFRVPREEIYKIVENVYASVGDRELLKVGENVFLISVLSNATGYFLDQENVDTASGYYSCIRPAINKHFEGKINSYSEYQKDALRQILANYESLGKEIMSK